MTTALDIITQALKAAGVLGSGQAASGTDTSDALFHLNAMIGQWNRKRWLVWHLIDTALTSTGAQSYTVGPGGDFNIPRPDRLEDAFFRQLINSSPNQVDYPFTVLQAREDYDRIRLKNLTTWPESIFYDAANPLGVVYPWPLPLSGLFEIHIITKDTLSTFATTNTAFSFPPEYLAALDWNLAVRLRPLYGLREPDPSLIAFAKDSLNVIRNANTQIPRLRMPRTLRGEGVYNIFSDGPNAN